MSIEDLIEKAKTKPIEAGSELVVGLMAHDPSSPFRRGYSLGSALMSAKDLLGLTPNQIAAVADAVVKPLLQAAEGVRYHGLVMYELDHALERFGVPVQEQS